MAIDLAHKLTQVADSHPDALAPEQLQAMEYAAQSTRGHANPRQLVGDPAAWASDFGYALDAVSMRIDARPSEELRTVALDHPSPLMREQALYEYADRSEPDAIELLTQAIKHDRNQQLRWDALWALEKLGGLSAIQALKKFTDDDDLEIAEWARLFVSELETGDPAFDRRAHRYIEGRTFDETIFLLIHCDLYISLKANGSQWGKLSLTPQGLARVYGQAHACPNVATRNRKLVIAKTIEDLHEDGSPHVDNYLFRGLTNRTAPDRGDFFFESQVDRPFYISGHADDHSQGVHEASIGFKRQGRWYLDRNIEIKNDHAIRYVRGRFQGWGYANLSRVMGQSLEQMLTPGNAILSTLHDPVAGPLTNVFISGTFKGKLNDWDGDGHIDLNSRDVYSTTEGEIDMNQDGVADQSGVTCCPWVSPF